VAGRASEENYQQVMRMVDRYKEIKDVDNHERLDTAKETIMVFPGITKMYIEKQKALDYLNEPLNTTEKLIKVLFKVQVDM